MKEQEYEDAMRLLERYYADIERNIDKPIIRCYCHYLLVMLENA